MASTLLPKLVTTDLAPPTVPSPLLLGAACDHGSGSPPPTAAGMARIHLFSTSAGRDDVDSHLLLPPCHGRLYPLRPRLAAQLLEGDLEEYLLLTVASSLLPN